MPFEKFKERHGGEGPFQLAYGALFPEGILGRRGLAGERELTDELVGQIRELEDVHNLEPMLAAAERPLTRDQHQQIRAALSGKVIEQRTLAAGFETFQHEQQRLLEANPADREQLGTMGSQMEIAHRYMTSGNPELEKAGTALAAKVLDAQQAYTTTNEAQRIAMGEQQWSHYQSVADDARIESAPFLEQRAAIGRIKALFVDEPTAATDLSLIFNYMKLLDPGSVVRESEFAQAQNLAGVPDIIITARNRLVQDGERLTPKERAEFYEAAERLYKEAQGGQMERNSRYLERARNGGVPETWLDELIFPIDTPQIEEPNFGTEHGGEMESTGEETPTGVLRDTATGIGDIYQGARRGVTDALEGAGNAVNAVRELAEGPVPSSEPLSGIRNVARRITGAAQRRRQERAARRPTND